MHSSWAFRGVAAGLCATLRDCNPIGRGMANMRNGEAQRQSHDKPKGGEAKMDNSEVDSLMAEMIYPKMAAYAVPRIRDKFAITHEEAIAVWREAKKRMAEKHESDTSP